VRFLYFLLFAKSQLTTLNDNRFQYCARRILYNLSVIRDSQSRSPRSEGDKGVIRINERDGNLSTGMKLRRACCT